MTSSIESVLTRIQALLQVHFNLAPADLAPERPLESLGIDSLAAVEFMLELEDTFRVSLAKERTDVVTVGDIAAVVQRAMSRTGSGV